MASSSEQELKFKLKLKQILIRSSKKENWILKIYGIIKKNALRKGRNQIFGLEVYLNLIHIIELKNLSKKPSFF